MFSPAMWWNGLSLNSSGFFESLLSFAVGLRVQRANGETSEVQPPQKLAHAAFMQADAKLGSDAVAQIGTPEPHDAIAGEIGALLDPGCNCPVLPSSGFQLGRFAPGQRDHQTLL